MVEKLYVTWNEVDHMVDDLINQMFSDSWKPDYIVGITRGGLTPALMMSHRTNIKMHTLDVRLRDGDGQGPESNCWMAEDALGYTGDGLTHDNHKKNILIIDDINDSGKTLNWIRNDWSAGCLPNHKGWDNVWHNNVRFACLIDNGASNFGEVDYTALEINKEEDPVWIVYPWEGERDYGNF